jgi:tetratricopeptide (TPR) repeat protein
MGQILNFPGRASKFGYKRARKRARTLDHPDQLHLHFDSPAQILSFSPVASSFEQALMFDEREDAKAAEFYRRAIDEGICVADAFCNLGIIESRHGNTSKAFDCFTTSLKHNPRHFEAHYNLGNLYFDVNDFRLAQIHYEMAAEVDPSFSNLYFNLALVQAINNDLAAAAIALGRYQQLVPEDEARHADELVQNLRKTLAASRNSRCGSSLSEIGETRQ